ncbi:MAG: DUF4440 domain-containing protein, partial [Candidatus Acidiferrales bacterium]
MKVFAKCVQIAFLVAIAGTIGQAPLEAFPSPAAKEVIVKADHSFSEAVDKGDASAVGAILDQQFEWTNPEGATSTKDEALKNLAALKGKGEAATDTR